VVNLLKTWYTKFYQNWPSFTEDSTRAYDVFFYSRYSAANSQSEEGRVRKIMICFVLSALCSPSSQ